MFLNHMRTFAWTRQNTFLKPTSVLADGILPRHTEKMPRQIW
jgi:hypothetical protein